MKKIKIGLFALTGLGNNVIDALLLSNKIKIIFVSTRKEKGNFPYYKCENIVEKCNRKNIPIYFDLKKSIQKIDICIVATYHLKIDVENNDFKKGFNIHPSYLPDYKGKDPIKDVIKSRESITGVTLHKLTNRFDEGQIYQQKKIKISRKDNKASLLKKMNKYYFHFTNYILENYKTL